ncbi:MAG TPA: hypothetical protein VD836_15475 [Solirubrobacteraceae bacterium]|nr:hypothetical protein [Solirubrobacteraceae bacterium]
MHAGRIRKGPTCCACLACVVAAASAAPAQEPPPDGPADPPAVAAALRLAGTDGGLRPGCRTALGMETAAAWCGPTRRVAARLRSPSPRESGPLPGTSVLRIAGGPLAVGERVRLRRLRPVRRAQLVVLVRDGSVLTYARFGALDRLGPRAIVRTRRTAGGVAVELAGRRARELRRGRIRAPAAPPPPVPPAPPPAAPDPGPPASRLVIEECGGVAPATVDDVDGFNRLWGADRAGPGWTGGDVTFSAPLPDGRVAWIFGDTFVGHVTADGRRSGGMVRNTVVIQDGPCLQTHATGTAEQPGPLITPDEEGTWYWPADATVADGRLHVHAWRMRATGPGPWEFAITGTDLVTFDLPDLALRAIRPLPAGPGVAWGAAVAEDGDTTYVYGVSSADPRDPVLHVARSTGGLEAPWEYATADGWAEDPAASTAQLHGVSHQLTVLRDGDGFALITQEPLLGPEILVYRGAGPAGPWVGPERLAVAPAPAPGTFTYNAVAHPQAISGGRLLLSYNVNSLDPTVLGDAAVYRPRFIAVAWPPDEPAEPR